MRFLLGLSAFFLVCSVAAVASPGLVVHASEFGVGKFHRMDNQVHPYDKNSAWMPYVLPIGASTDQALTVNNADGSVTVFYSTLDELISQVTRVAQTRGTSISVLNIHGHGAPGTMWFPADATTLQSSDCADWKAAATGSDQDNYNQYYSPVSADEIREIRVAASYPGLMLATCTSGLPEWKTAIAKAPAFTKVLAPGAQIHFLSCVVGLGVAGQQFTEGMAALLFPQNGQARVETSTNFGLGDWSMPEGMGFWDLVSDDQVQHDGQLYTQDKKDREIMQKGTVRVVTYSASGWQSALLADQQFMQLGFGTTSYGRPVPEPVSYKQGPLPTRIRIPGTTSYLRVK